LQVKFSIASKAKAAAQVKERETESEREESTKNEVVPGTTQEQPKNNREQLGNNELFSDLRVFS